MVKRNNEIKQNDETIFCKSYYPILWKAGLGVYTSNMFYIKGNFYDCVNQENHSKVCTTTIWVNYFHHREMLFQVFINST